MPRKSKKNKKVNKAQKQKQKQSVNVNVHIDQSKRTKGRVQRIEPARHHSGPTIVMNSPALPSQSQPDFTQFFQQLAEFQNVGQGRGNALIPRPPPPPPPPPPPHAPPQPRLFPRPPPPPLNAPPQQRLFPRHQQPFINVGANLQNALVAPQPPAPAQLVNDRPQRRIPLNAQQVAPLGLNIMRQLEENDVEDNEEILRIPVGRSGRFAPAANIQHEPHPMQPSQGHPLRPLQPHPDEIPPVFNKPQDTPLFHIAQFNLGAEDTRNRALIDYMKRRRHKRLLNEAERSMFGDEDDDGEDYPLQAHAAPVAVNKKDLDTEEGGGDSEDEEKQGPSYAASEAGTEVDPWNPHDQIDDGRILKSVDEIAQLGSISKYLSSLNVKELKIIAKAAELRGTSRLSREPLLKALTANVKAYQKTKHPRGKGRPKNDANYQ